MRLDKPIGIFLLLWPTLWALWLAAEGFPGWHLFLVFTLGVFLMRSAGCVINDYADRDFDGAVKRTRARPLATGKVTAGEALLLFVVLALAAFALVLTLNRFTIALSVGGVLLAAAYPFMKRYTWFPQLVLGAAFAWSIPMAFAARGNEVPELAWLLYIATLLWVLAYDTLYAMVDRDDDIRLGLKSTAILFGDADLAIIASVQALFMTGMLMVGGRADLGIWYYAGWLVAAGLIVWQLWSCRSRDRDACFKAFLNNNYVGMALFAGMVVHYLLTGATST